MDRGRKVAWPRRGDVYLVAFDPTVGAEIKKTRPALIIQNDVANRYSPVTIVAAITSHTNDELYPTEVLVMPPEAGLKNASVVQLGQVRSIDKQRLVRPLGRVSSRTLRAVDRAIAISVGLVELH